MNQFSIPYISKIVANGLVSNWGEPHTSKTFVLSPIHKDLQIKIEELTNASIFIRVMVHDTVNLMA